MEGLTAAFSGAFDAAQQWLFEAVIGPARNAINGNSTPSRAAISVT